MGKIRKRIRIIDDLTGELPNSLIGRYGYLLGRAPREDVTVGPISHKAYRVSVDTWKKEFILYDDEFRLV